MASVPNRVYPMNEFNEVDASCFAWKSVKGLLTYSGSAKVGEIYIFTGAAGITAYLGLKLPSGSVYAIWTSSGFAYYGSSVT